MKNSSWAERLRRFLGPSVYSDLEKTELARTSQAMLWLTVVTVSVYFVIMAIIYPANSVHFLSFEIAALFISVVGFRLNTSGRTLAAIPFVTISAWIVVSVLAFTSGGIKSAATLGYFAIILVSGLLAGGRAALLAWIVCWLTELVLVYLSSHQLLPAPAVVFTDTRLWVVHGMFYLLAMIFPYLATSSIRRSLRRAELEIENKNRAQRLLKESEERFRDLSMVGLEGVMIHEGWKILDVNQALVSLLGIEQPDELVGKNGLESIPLTEDSKVSLQKLSDSGSTEPVEIKIVLKGGKTLDVEAIQRSVIYKERDAGVLIMRDITDRKQVNEALRFRESQLQAVLDNSRDAIGVHINGIWQMCNPAALDLFGVSNEKELIGTSILNVIAPSERSDVNEFVRNRNQGRSAPLEYVTRGLKANGTEFDMEVKISSYMLEDKLHIMVIFHDITKKNRAEEALRESESRFRKLSEVALEGIAITENALLMDGNAKLAAMLGYDLAEMIGRPISNFIAPEDRAEVLKQIAENSEAEYEHLLLRKDGSLVPVSSHARTMDWQGRSIRVTAFLDLTQSKKAAAEARESELRYRELIASMPVGHYKSTSAGRVIEINPAFCKMVGYSEEELLAMNVPETLYFQASEREGETKYMGFLPVTEIYRLKSKSGAAVWMEDFARYIRDETGKIAFHEGICIDITERKLASEKELRQSKETGIMNELSALLLGSEHSDQRILDLCVERCAELIGDGASIFLYHKANPNLELAAVYNENHEAVRIFKDYFNAYPMRFDELGYGEVLSTNQAKFVPTVDMDRLIDAADQPRREYYSKLPLYSAIFTPLRDRGVCIGVLGLARHDPKGPKYTERDLRFVQDIADRAAMAISASRVYGALRKEVEEHRLAENQLRLQSVALDTAANEIIITDKEGCMVWANRAFESVTGYAVHEAIGKNPRELIKSGMQERGFYKNMWDTILSGRVWQGEIINKKKNGTLYTEYMTIAPVRDDQGTITHFVAVKQDITERKILQEQVLQSQKLEGIGQLAGGIAHDYNNILGVIIGYAELLKLKMSGDPKERTPVDAILVAASRGADLTRQLLAFARKEMVSPRVININFEIQSIEKVLRRLIGENIKLEFQPGQNVWNVKIDPSQVDQILVNLAANSRDAIRGVGTIRIQTENVTIDENYAAIRTGLSAGEFVKLSVEDNGIGMQEETLRRIFEPFFTTKERGQGTGLGLSTVYGIVKQNGGNINVKSKPGEGTTFEIYFPPSSESINESRDEQLETNLRGTETVLVVEDQADMLELTKASLEKYGYRVLTALGPGEGLLLCESHPGMIEVLLTDVIMPLMSGRELSKRVIASRPGIKTLFMSGYTANELNPEGIMDEQVEFIQKPFTPVELAKRVRDVLDHLTA